MSKKKKQTTNNENATKKNKKRVDDSKETKIQEEKKVKKDKTKEVKKPKKTNDKTETKRELISDPLKNSTNEMSKLIKIVLIVTGVMIIFYGITLVATHKADEVAPENDNTEEEKATEIQYENIMIGTMLNYRGTYYVLIESKDDNRVTEYESIITTVESSEDAPTIYKANLTDSFNKVYLGKEQNYYVDNIADFKVTGTVLVKVVDGKIDSVKDSYDDIKAELNDLV